MKNNLAAYVIASLLGGFSLAVNAAVIDFEADTAGGKANGFSAAGHPGVTFTDTMGADLAIGGYGVQGLGAQSLAVFGDDVSKLRIDFSSSQSSLSLSFGNDDPGFSAAGDRAWLELFNGATSVGLFSVVMNRDDVMNQSISGSAVSFDNALFWYGTAAGAPIGLIEIVDQIEFTRGEAVPDGGSTLGLSLLALLGLVAARRKLVS